MVIVTDKNRDELNSLLLDKMVFVHPVVVDSFCHPTQTTVSSVHIHLEYGGRYSVPVKHPDAPSQPISLWDCSQIVVVNKKEFLQLFPLTDPKKVVDLSSMVYLSHLPPLDLHKLLPQFIRNVYGRFKFKNLNLSVPFTLWCQYADSVLDLMVKTYATVSDVGATRAYSFLNDVAIPTLSKVEESGLWTVDGKLEHSQYNLYTSTGRPSNAFGGVNYAALNKSDGTRDKYVSRHGDNGTLVQFDYEAFHLRILAMIIGYDLPKTSVHRHLAELYYGTTEITPELYEESKARTFALMYGHTEDTNDIEFFRKVREYIQSFSGDRFLSTKGREVIVPDPSPAKLFNYFMQLAETEIALSRVKTIVDDGEVDVILYTYDAILLDVHNDDLPYMSKVKDYLSTGKFPVRQYRGSSYGSLQEFIDT